MSLQEVAWGLRYAIHTARDVSLNKLESLFEEVEAPPKSTSDYITLRSRHQTHQSVSAVTAQFFNTKIQNTKSYTLKRVYITSGAICMLVARVCDTVAGVLSLIGASLILGTSKRMNKWTLTHLHATTGFLQDLPGFIFGMIRPDVFSTQTLQDTVANVPHDIATDALEESYGFLAGFVATVGQAGLIAYARWYPDTTSMHFVA